MYEDLNDATLPALLPLPPLLFPTLPTDQIAVDPKVAVDPERKATFTVYNNTVNVNKDNVTGAKVSMLNSGYIITETMTDSLNTIFSIQNINEAGFVRNTFKATTTWDKITVSTGAATIKNLPNAGGTSVNSEVFSFDMLDFLLNAKLQATEMQLEYFPLGSKITDYSVSIGDQTFGVSVTRAMKFGGGVFDDTDAYRLLSKKLFGVNASTKAVLKRFRWKKQILHIWAESTQVADTLARVYHSEIDDDLKNNTLVMVTVCANDNTFIFYDR